MKKLIASMMLMLSATPVFAADVARVPETCEATIYRAMRKLPQHTLGQTGDQFVSQIYKNQDRPDTMIDMTLMLDMGRENYCIKGGSSVPRYG